MRLNLRFCSTSSYMGAEWLVDSTLAGGSTLRTAQLRLNLPEAPRGRSYPVLYSMDALSLSRSIFSPWLDSPPSIPILSPEARKGKTPRLIRKWIPLNNNHVRHLREASFGLTSRSAPRCSCSPSRWIWRKPHLPPGARLPARGAEAPLPLTWRSLIGATLIGRPS